MTHASSKGPERPGQTEQQSRQASALDPGYAEPRAELAILWALDARSASNAERAQSAIDDALSLDADLARAILARGVLLQLRLPPDYPGAEAAFRLALERDPNMVDASNWLANNLEIQGRYAERLTVLERAARIDPLAPALMSNLSSAYAEHGDFAKAEQILRKLLELPQPSPYIPWSLSDLYFSKGRLVDSHEMAKRLVMVEAGSSDRGESFTFLARSYSRVGMWQQARDWQQRIERVWPRSEWPGLKRAELLRMEGLVDDMRTALRAALQTKDGELPPPAPPPECGILQALSGDYRGAVRTLEAAHLDIDGPLSEGENDANLRHALAWAYLNTGATDRAHRIVNELERQYRDRQAQGWMHLSIDLAMFAQNAALAGNKDLAVDRLRKAVDEGWRDYYSVSNDPRWGSLRDDPRFRQLMDSVKADIDSQRARLAQAEAADDFAARVDETLRNRASRTDSGP